MTLMNFWAASAKRNMHAFGLFPSTMDLFWISDNASGLQTPVTVPFSATPAFDIAAGTIQRITLTGNVTSSTFTFNGGSVFSDGQQFWLHVIQNGAGGHTFQLPVAVRNPAALVVGTDPDIETSFQLEYRAGGWDIITAPVEGPASPQIPVTVPYSTTPVFEISDGLIQRLTMTGDVASSTITYNGSATMSEGTQFWMHIIQDGTGGRLFQMPDNVRNPGTMVVGLGANVMTSFLLEYRSSGWDIIVVPAEGPAV